MTRNNKEDQNVHNVLFCAFVVQFCELVLANDEENALIGSVRQLMQKISPQWSFSFAHLTFQGKSTCTIYPLCRKYTILTL